jgi:nitrite reductase/ring-hydroxylating ferredoxin subunit
MAAGARLIDICASDALTERGHGARFEVSVAGRVVPAFVVRFDGIARGYLNRCAHVAMELDWQPGDFFDFEREHLVCSTHGALYEPATGTCAGGACAGRGGLRALNVVEKDGRVAWQPDGYAEAPAAKEG